MKRFVLTTIGVCGLAGWMLSLAFLLFTHTVLKDMAGLVRSSEARESIEDVIDKIGY